MSSLDCALACADIRVTFLFASNNDQDNAQQFKFGLAYYNLARMLGLQHMWNEAL